MAIELGRHRIVGVLAIALVLSACPAEAPPSPSALASGTPEGRPSATPSPPPTPSPTPFPVRDSAEADALFSRPDTCTNPEVGYTVAFPDDWYTNTAIGEQAPCTWFTPDFFEVDTPGEVPEEIWIGIGLIEGHWGYTMLTPTVSSDEIEIDGHSGHRAEYRTLDSIGDTDSGRLTYHYVLRFEDVGSTLIASTAVDAADDYELAKAVLDRIMASMELDPVRLSIPDEPTGPPLSGDPITVEDADASFRLTLEADQDRYRAGQEIHVMATLTYLGPANAIIARGSSNPGLIGFSVANEDLPIRTGSVFTTDCGPHEMTRGLPVEYPFAKTGSFSPDDPFSGFIAQYLAMEELRLPAGIWAISAGGGWSIGDCGSGEPHSLGASVTVEVEP